ncbi:hypothetical protein ACLKA6_012675 [Drosophila palustris]
MAFKFLLLALALIGAVTAEYDYSRSTNNNNNNNNINYNPKGSEINSQEQHDSSSSEEYRTNYQTPQNNADNSEATPKGYDYTYSNSNSNSDSHSNSHSNSNSNSDSNVLHDVTSSAAAATALFPVPLPVLREQRQPEIFPPATYSFNYAVNDESTGDIKDHSETRDGYVVRGSYSLIDPDGFKRTVTYTADNIHGFNAVVNRVPYVLKNLAVVAPSARLDERSQAALVSAVPSSSAVDSVKSRVENTASSGSRDSYVSAAHDRDTTGGIYA